MKDGLSKMADVLREHNLVGEQWAKYMGIKSHLLKRQFLFMMDPAVHRSLNKIKPLVRIRDGQIVWHGDEKGDFLSEIGILDLEYLMHPEKHGFQPHKVYDLQKIREITVWFPSKEKTVFVPSTVQVLQQMPEQIDVNNLFFEIRLDSADECEAYDEVLGCHQATVILYRMVSPNRNLLDRARERMLSEQNKKKNECGLNDINVNEVRKVKKPQGPKRQMPSRSH